MKKLLALTTLLLAACGPAGGNSQMIDDAAQTSVRGQIAEGDDGVFCLAGNTTPEVTEGPYYKEDSPEENELLVEGMSGQPIRISGYVYDDNCTPVPGAWVDIWQADEHGVYDNEGYRLRGHTYTNDTGRYSVLTEVPGMYEGRTLHIHAKAGVLEGEADVTTQLFFPGVEANASDDIFKEELLVDIDTSTQPWSGTFHFVLPD